jgi:putative ABC transport system permease protein
MDAANSLRPRVTPGSRASHTSNMLITAQIALAFVLLTVGALLSHDFLQLRYLDIGYDPRGVYATSVSGSRAQRSNPTQWKAIAAETRAQVARLRGVRSASLVYQNASHPNIVHADAPAERPAAHDPRVQAVDPDFFATWKTPILLGRAFAPADRAGGASVAIVNKAAADTFWPGQNPLGRRVFVGDSAAAGEWLTVVGVSADIEGSNYRFRHSPIVYRPFDQAPLYHVVVQLSVRVADDRPDVLAAAQSVIRRTSGRWADPLTSEEARLGTRYMTSRFSAIAIDVFAAFGLLLAAMGIYGSIAFAVTQRTREIGIRVALGAARSNVLALIARRGIVVTAVGATIGVVASFAVTRVFQSMVSATSVTNPWVVIMSVGIVLVVSSIATLLPARRATAVSPVIALRAD